MRWKKGETSQDIEDRRGASGGRKFPGGAKGAGIAGVVVLLVGMFLGVDVSKLVGGGSDGGGEEAKETPVAEDSDTERRLVKFVSFVLDDAQATWKKKFREMGKTYERTKLVLYRQGTETAGCGYGKSAIGPFYCPADKKVYLDFSFFNVMKQRLGADGEFAQAYVLAHEVAHHVQNLLGASGRVRAEKRGKSKIQKNRLSVKLELQADCYAGIWANATAKRGVVESGDIDKAIRAAKAIGDDTLQKNAGRQVREESFTHGSAAQRVKWFKRGQSSGNIKRCDTFAELR